MTDIPILDVFAEDKDAEAKRYALAVEEWSNRVLIRPKNPRPSWDAWGLTVASAVATRADCTRKQVGAVIVRASDHAIMSTGYNGAPSGQPGCLTDGACPRGQSNLASKDLGSSYDTGPGACIALHAEQNAIIRASHDQMVGATLYITHEPCDGCHRMIMGTPLARVVAPNYEWKKETA